MRKLMNGWRGLVLFDSQTDGDALEVFTPSEQDIKGNALVRSFGHQKNG